MKKALVCLALSICLAAPQAFAQVQLSDFVGVWERAGPGGPGGAAGEGPSREGVPRGGAPGWAERNAPRTGADGSVTLGLGAPPPDEGRTPGLSEADAALGLERDDIAVRNQMTAAGRERFAQFRLIDHPMYNCISPGLPTVVGMPGLQNWSAAGDAISISHETWPEPRTASLSAAADAPAPKTRQGYAYARIKGEALVITTTQLTEAWGGLARNAPGSDARTVVETYRKVDADTIRGEIVITDPKFLTQPLRRPITLRRAAAGTTFETFPCELEASQQALPK